MNKPVSDHFEKQIRLTARGTTYPRTPDVSRSVYIKLIKPRRIGNLKFFIRIVVVAIVVLTALALAVPQVRAQIAGFFKIGVIRIYPFSIPTAATHVEVPLTATPTRTEINPVLTASTAPATPTPNNIPLALRGLAGLTTLQQAQKLTGFRIQLPAYPKDLGNPDFVFYQNGIQMLVLAWADPGDPLLARLSLYEFLSNNLIVNKFQPVIVKETTVNRAPAIWAEGPYIVKVTNGNNFELRQIVIGNSLIWEHSGITYRLETDQSLQEAVKIAESLR
jgi:hypothetical protein